MMFGRKKSEQTDAPLAPENLVAPVVTAPSRPPSTPPLAEASLTKLNLPQSNTSPFPNRMPTMPPRPSAPEIARPSEHLRRPTELGAPLTATLPTRHEPELRQLIVGREITLQGEIKTCDSLIVEGSVEANLYDCREAVISETGLFKGSAEVDNLEVRGRFEGSLTVNNRLLIHATGSVTGTIRYGQLQVECGGRVSGDVQSQQPGIPGILETPEFRKERMPSPIPQSVVDIEPSRLM